MRVAHSHCENYVTEPRRAAVEVSMAAQPPGQTAGQTAGQPLRTVRSFCRVCTSVCGILVDVAGDEVVRVRGDPDHPLSRGYTCAKGRALPRLHHHADRIERPLLRIDGRLQPTTWEDCLDDLGTRVRTIIERHGPASVGIFFGSGVGMDAAGYRMAQRLHAAIGTPAKFSPLTIDGTAKVLVSDLVGGSVGLNARPDYDDARLVIYFGSNPVVSHGHTVAIPDPVSSIRALCTRADVWIVDPRRTETARLATRHVAPRPGTDYALLAFLVREVLREGADRDVVDHRTVGAEALAAAVEPFTIDHAAQIADVPEADLTDLLRAVRAAERVAIETGTGITMAASANVTQWLAWALMIVTGSMNQHGGAWFHPGFGHQLETLELPISSPDGSFGPGPRSRPETHAFLREWPCAVLADEIRAGNIRAMLNLGGHLVTAFPNTTDLVPALESLEVFATLEIIANDTTALSSHVLPTKDQLERADVTLWDFLSPRVSAQHTPPVVDAVGDRRSTWWVLAELGRRLGHDLADTAGAEATDDAQLARVTAGARCTFAELVAAGWVERSRELPARWVEQHIDRLGGWRLAPQLLVDQLAALDVTAPLVLVPRRQPRRLNSQFEYLGEPAEVVINPADANAAGVLDGQVVVVRSAHGELAGTAKVDSSVRAGVVSVAHGHQGANVNVLTGKDEIDLVTGMARYSGVPVTVEPQTGRSLTAQVGRAAPPT
jgi:anaerobic selenocysteine-containing dehydrogenase